jgi:hypothetical protein
MNRAVKTLLAALLCGTTLPVLGATIAFGPELRVAEPAAGQSQTFPAIANAGGRVVTAWQEGEVIRLGITGRDPVTVTERARFTDSLRVFADGDVVIVLWAVGGNQFIMRRFTADLQPIDALQVPVTLPRTLSSYNMEIAAGDGLMLVARMNTTEAVLIDYSTHELQLKQVSLPAASSGFIDGLTTIWTGNEFVVATVHNLYGYGQPPLPPRDFQVRVTRIGRDGAVRDDFALATLVKQWDVSEVRLANSPAGVVAAWRSVAAGNTNVVATYIDDRSSGARVMLPLQPGDYLRQITWDGDRFHAFSNRQTDSGMRAFLYQQLTPTLQLLDESITPTIPTTADVYRWAATVVGNRPVLAYERVTSGSSESKSGVFLRSRETPRRRSSR